MISRLTALAATFAILATASLTYAAGLHTGTPAAAAKHTVRVVQLERVVVTAKRLSAPAN
jgi:hypothetical protein